MLEECVVEVVSVVGGLSVVDVEASAAVERVVRLVSATSVVELVVSSAESDVSAADELLVDVAGDAVGKGTLLRVFACSETLAASQATASIFREHTGTCRGAFIIWSTRDRDTQLALFEARLALMLNIVLPKSIA